MTGPESSAETPLWFDDPVEVDRYLEGEAGRASDAFRGPVEQGTRRADVAARPELAARLEVRERFLAGLAAAGQAYRAELSARTPPLLGRRVRAALVRSEARRRRLWRYATAAAAVLIAAIGLSLRNDTRHDARAMPLQVIQAADVARHAQAGPRGCEVPAETGPMQFPPVRDGSLRVWRCREDAQSTVAQLYRPEDLPSIGYAAVAAEGVDRGPDLGRTDLGDIVVFDLAYGRRRHYLAVAKTFLDAQRKRTPGRESCRACHNLSRVGKPNPHNIVQRSWRPGG